MMKNILFTFFIFLLLLSSCKSRIPDHVLKPEAMKTLIWDMMVSAEVNKSDTSTNTKLHIRDSITSAFGKILAIHKVSKEDYNKSIAFYEANPAVFQALLDSARSYGKVLQDSLHYHSPVPKTGVSDTAANRKNKDSLLKLHAPSKIIINNNLKKRLADTTRNRRGL